MTIDLLHMSDRADAATAASRGSSPPPTPVVGMRGSSRTPLRLVSRTSVPAGRVVAEPSSDQGRPIGVAFVASADHSGGRIYVCDPEAHTINVLDHYCRPLFSFGGFGSRLGQFDSPSDVIFVRLETGDPCVDAGLLVVADRGNHRLQMFEIDGAVIGEVGGLAGRWTPGRFPAPTGSPFFRLGDVPPLPFPSRLEWRAPYIDVACACSAIRLDLAAMLLPDFTTWIAQASPADLRSAFLRFATDPNRADIPQSCLDDIVERLQPSWRRAETQRQPARS
jgi:hypothetical protein